MPHDGSGRLSPAIVFRLRALVRVKTAAVEAIGWLRRMMAGAPSALVRLVRALPDWAEWLRKVATSLAVVGGIVLVPWMVYYLSSNDPLVFDRISVPEGLKNRVPPGDQLALRISDHFDQYNAAIGRLRKTKDVLLVREADLPKLAIPGAEMSVQAVVQVVRRFLDFQEQRVGGEFFLSEESLAAPAEGSSIHPCPDRRAGYLVVRLSANRGELAEAVEMPLCAKKTDGKLDFEIDASMLEPLLQLAALRAYERVNPCGSAAYYFDNWYRKTFDGRMLDPKFLRTTRLIGACMEARVDEAGYAHHLLGRVRQANQRPSEALGFFEAAENLHHRSRSWLRRALDWVGVWRIRLPDLYAHWGSALMDLRQWDAALEKFEEEFGRGAASALAYKGKGNALVELAGGDRRKLEAAVEVYCEGALLHRFDAEIRHALADLLEQKRELVGCQTWKDKKKTVRENILRLRHKAADVAPTERKYLVALGRFLREVREYDVALAIFGQALHESGQEDWDAYVGLAQTYVLMGRPDRAESTYRRAVDAYEHLASRRLMDAEVRYRGALASLGLGWDERARQLAEAARERDPTLEGPRLLLACVRWRARQADLTPPRNAGAPGTVDIDVALRECELHLAEPP